MDFIGDSGGFTRDKTGLFGAVRIDDREVGWGNLGAGGFLELAGGFWIPALLLSILEIQVLIYLITLSDPVTLMTPKMAIQRYSRPRLPGT